MFCALTLCTESRTVIHNNNNNNNNNKGSAVNDGIIFTSVLQILTKVKAGTLLAYKMDQMDQDNLHNSAHALVNAHMLPNHAPAKAAWVSYKGWK